MNVGIPSICSASKKSNYNSEMDKYNSHHYKDYETDANERSFKFFKRLYNNSFTWDYDNNPLFNEKYFISENRFNSLTTISDYENEIYNW